MSPLPQLLAASPNGSAGAGVTLYPVQISIQTKNITNASSYDLVAYNSTGIPVASYTGLYAQVTFEIPSGTYLFAAAASGPSQSQTPVCCVCAQSGSGVISPPAQTKNSSSGPAIILPCYYSSPPMEYGYSLTGVSGSTTLTIATQPFSGIPTADVSVTVNFQNGTAVSGAYVSASVVGADWYQGDDSNTTMSNQTGTDGVAQLVVPAVPLTVTASDSVQVNLPGNQTTVQVNVGGQPVNVTLYYSPNYVYLSASSLLVPPQTTLSMVLRAQTESTLIPFAEGSASSGATTPGAAGVASPDSSQTPGSQKAAGALSTSESTTTAQISQIPPIPASDIVSAASTHPSTNISGIAFWEVGTLALAVALAAVIGIAISKRR